MNELNDELNDEFTNDLFELDTSWVDEFDKNDNEYKSYYNEELTLQPGNWITIAARTVTGTASYVTASLNTREDQ